MAKILIPDCVDLPQTAALRGLGRLGHTCDVAWPLSRKERKLIGRYCAQAFDVPRPGTDDPGFAKSILALCQSGNYDVLLPTRLTSLERLLPYRESLERCTSVLMPSDEQFRLGIDKQATIAMCRNLGITHPKTIFVREDSPWEGSASSLGYPVVVKHRRNFGASLGVRMSSNASMRADDIADLAALTGSRQDVMLQQFLPGTIFDACLVARNGKIAGMVTQERRLMKPTSGGVASILATVDIPQLDSLARFIVDALNWTGPAQIEFKWDPVARKFSLIEINPRFWATTGAWLKAGANFPALAVDLAMNRKTTALAKLPANLRFVYLMGRAPVSFYQLWKARGLKALKDPRSYTRTWYDFDLDDPLPDLFRLYQEICLSLKMKARVNSSFRNLPAEFDPSFAVQDCTPALQETRSINGVAPVAQHLSRT